MAVDTTARALALQGRGVQRAILPPKRRRRGLVVTTFQAGHGWENVSGTGRFRPNETNGAILGSQCLSVTTDAVGGPSRPEKTGLQYDLVGKYIRVLLDIDRPDQVEEFFLYVASGGTWANSVAKGLGGPPNLLPGVPEWVTLPLTPVIVEGSPDLAAVDRMRFTIRARTGVRVTLRLHAIEIVDDIGAVFPNGVISFTWDDGRVEQYSRARPILDRYLFPATAYVIAGQVEDSAGYFMSLGELHHLQDLSGWEIASHAPSLAAHAATFQGRTEAELDAAFTGVKHWLLTNGFHGGDHFAWPKSRYDETALRVAARYFATARTVSTMSWYHNAAPPEPRLHLGSKELGLGTSLEEAMVNVDLCRSAGTWLVFTGHALADRSLDGSTWAEADFRRLVHHVAQTNVPVMTVGDVVASLP